MFIVAPLLPSTANADKRVALVVGNSAYQNAVQLPNPERDAKAVADKLRKLGFVVVEGYDLSHDGFEDTIKDFSKAVRGADIGMFFYAGHGMQVSGRNYLVPVDAAFQDVTALDFEAIAMDVVTKQMQQDVAVRLVILDACRDNPLSKTLSRSMSGGTRSNAVAEGLAEVKLGDAGEGTAIIFATSPDEVALDGEGEHSPFTTALLNNIELPDTDLQVVMSRVTGEVYSATKQQQRPWINASLTGEVMLNPQAKAVAAKHGARRCRCDAAARRGQPGNAAARDDPLQPCARIGRGGGLPGVSGSLPERAFRRECAQAARAADPGSAGKAGRELRRPSTQPVARTVAPDVIELPVTDVVKAMPSNSETEDGLEFDRAKRVEIQTRLNLAGFKISSSDGSFGRKTRTAIQAWQTSRGLSRDRLLQPAAIRDPDAADRGAVRCLRAERARRGRLGRRQEAGSNQDQHQEKWRPNGVRDARRRSAGSWVASCAGRCVFDPLGIRLGSVPIPSVLTRPRSDHLRRQGPIAKEPRRKSSGKIDLGGFAGISLSPAMPARSVIATC